MDDKLEISKISKEEMGALYEGDVRFSPNNLTYKNRTTGKVFQVNANDVESISQIYMGNRPALRIMTKDGELHRFGSFSDGVSFAFSL